MNKLTTILGSDLLDCDVKSDQGINHGKGFSIWMHPPFHRILGWTSKPSSLKLSLDVWRLDQLKGIEINDVFVKGSASLSDQATINRFPTLMNAALLNKNGEKIANIVDFVFQPNTGKILYYLVSRSNPKIPGSSRWSLQVNDIKDQQPGSVFSNFLSINDLPLIRTSIREELLQKSKGLRFQFEEFTNKASSKLEGWLEESPWDENQTKFNNDVDYSNEIKNDNWIDNPNQLIEDDDNLVTQNINDLDDLEKPYTRQRQDNDPWI